VEPPNNRSTGDYLHATLKVGLEILPFGGSAPDRSNISTSYYVGHNSLGGLTRR